MPSKSLDEFFERLNKLLNNEKKSLSFLYRLNNNTYETFVTCEHYIFFSYWKKYAISKMIRNNLKI